MVNLFRAIFAGGDCAGTWSASACEHRRQRKVHLTITEVGEEVGKQVVGQDAYVASYFVVVQDQSRGQRWLVLAASSCPAAPLRLGRGHELRGHCVRSASGLM